MPSKYAGIGVSAGVAVGPVARVHGPVLPPRDGAPIDAAAETARALDSFEAVGSELEALASRAGASGAVLVRQARIARDPSLIALARQLVSSGRAAPRAPNRPATTTPEPAGVAGWMQRPLPTDNNASAAACSAVAHAARRHVGASLGWAVPKEAPKAMSIIPHQLLLSSPLCSL